MKYGIIFLIAVIFCLKISLSKRNKVKRHDLVDHKLHYVSNGEEVKFSDLYQVPGATNINIEGNKMNIGKENDPSNKKEDLNNPQQGGQQPGGPQHNNQPGPGYQPGQQGGQQQGGLQQNNQPEQKGGPEQPGNQPGPQGGPQQNNQPEQKGGAKNKKFKK